MAKKSPTWERRGSSRWRRREDGAEVWLDNSYWHASFSCNRMLKTKQDRPRRWKTVEAATLAVDKEYPPEHVWKKKAPEGWNFSVNGLVRKDGWKVREQRGSNGWQVLMPNGYPWQDIFETAEYAMQMVDTEHSIGSSEKEPTITCMFDAFVKKHKVALELIPALHRDFRNLQVDVRMRRDHDIRDREQAAEKRVREQLGVGDEKLTHELLDRAEQKLIVALNSNPHRDEWQRLSPFGPPRGLRTFEIAEAVQGLHAISELRLLVPTGSKAKKKAARRKRAT